MKQKKNDTITLSVRVSPQTRAALDRARGDVSTQRYLLRLIERAVDPRAEGKKR